ncbi:MULTISPECIES: ROK family protein [unclassified Microbacterium]|uniref:ROK family protein n=1 Tax=unclassified Microbacterium TaxID=2609290 RepID=UPI001E310A48|nr:MULTISPECIES: ROK family protein [unclassified Microbacterium]
MKARLPEPSGSSGRDLALAIDIGGTKVEAALIDRGGRRVPGSSFREPTGTTITRSGLEKAVLSAATRAFEARPADGDVIGIGVGSAGPIDLVTGTIAPLNMPGADGAEVRSVIGARFAPLPVRMALDGSCIALAEYRFGAARGALSALALIVSTGVGGGFIVNGQPTLGRSGNAGHIGQLRLRERLDADPFAGTVESLGSGPRTVAWAREQGWDGATGEELAVSYASGDPIAHAAVQRSARAVGEAISGASTLLDLDIAVVAGGFSNVARDYVDLVQRFADESSVLPYARRVRVVPSGLSGDGPIVGAATLALFADD